MMAIDQLKKEPAYQGLTPQQKTFLVEYCTNGNDKAAATKIAYPNCNGKPSLTAVSNANIKNKKIALLINKYFGYDPDSRPMDKDELMGLISTRLREGQNIGCFMNLVNMYLRLTGWGSKASQVEPEPDEPGTPKELDVNELVRQMEQQRGK